MFKKRYEILLPLKFNDGTAVSPRKFTQTKRELVRRFGAVTFETTPVQGIWIDQGVKFHDELIRVVLDVEDSDDSREFFVQYKERLKQRFNQIDIWIAGYPIDII